ncbi:Methylated-DNA--protein-cysteine methyltransferase [Bienertia sinuspersici]
MVLPKLRVLLAAKSSAFLRLLVISLCIFRLPQFVCCYCLVAAIEVYVML